MKFLNTHARLCIANEINIVSIYQESSNRCRRKFEKNIQLKRRLSERERHFGNANYEYVPDPLIVIPRVLEAYAAGSKPEDVNFTYLGDKFPRIYKKNYIGLLESLAREEFSDLTLIHVTRSPLEVVNSICRRINNSRVGLDSWRAVESIEEAIYEWKSAWNARKLLYPKIPFNKVVDLNYNSLVCDPPTASFEISNLLGVEDIFDRRVVSDAPIEWCLDKSQRQKVYSSFPPVMLCDNWHKFGLFLDKHSFVFK